MQNVQSEELIIKFARLYFLSCIYKNTYAICTNVHILLTRNSWNGIEPMVIYTMHLYVYLWTFPS